jgi:hypothetical protein
LAASEKVSPARLAVDNLSKADIFVATLGSQVDFCWRARMSSVEQKLNEALEQRRPCNFSAGTPVDDLEKGSEWGPDRTIEAALLRKILIGATGSDGLADQPVEIIGALIKGKVDLRAATVKRPLLSIDASFLT